MNLLILEIMMAFIGFVVKIKKTLSCNQCANHYDVIKKSKVTGSAFTELIHREQSRMENLL